MIRLLSLALCALLLLPVARLAAADPPPDDPIPPGAGARFGSPRFADFSLGGLHAYLAFSPDGKQLATAGNNSPICVWDAGTGKLIRTRRTPGSVQGLCWRPDGKLVAVSFFDHNNFFMSEWGDGPDEGPGVEKLQQMHQAARAKGNPKGEYGYPVLSPDGRKVLYVRSTPEPTSKRAVDVYDFTPNVASVLIEPKRAISLGKGGTGAGMSGDGKFLLADLGANGRQLAGYDLSAGKDADKPTWEVTFETANERRHPRYLSPDGRRVVVVFLNGDAELWDGPAGKLVRKLPQAPIFYLTGGGEHSGVAFSPDGKRLGIVTRRATGEVGGQIIDLDTGKELVSLVQAPMPRMIGLAFSPDGKRLALAGTGSVRVWDCETGKDACPLPGHRGPINSVATSPDGKTVVTAGDDLTVRAWDPATGREKWKVTFPQAVSVAFATADTVVLDGEEGAEPLLDLTTGKARPLPGVMGEVRKGTGLGFGAVRDRLVAIAPDGKSAVTLHPPADPDSASASLRFWSWPGGELKKSVPLDVPKGRLAVRCRARFTPDGKELMSVTTCDLRSPPFSGPRTPLLLIDKWDAATFKRLDRKEAGNVSPVWAGDGSRLLVVRDKGEVRDAFSEKVVAKFAESPTDPFVVWTLGTMAVSPDGSTFAVGGGFSSPGVVRLYDAKTGEVAANLPAGGRGRIQALYLPDGRLVTVGETAITWKKDAGAGQKR